MRPPSWGVRSTQAAPSAARAAAAATPAHASPSGTGSADKAECGRGDAPGGSSITPGQLQLLLGGQARGAVGHQRTRARSVPGPGQPRFDLEEAQVKDIMRIGDLAGRLHSPSHFEAKLPDERNGRRRARLGVLPQRGAEAGSRQDPPRVGSEDSGQRRQLRFRLPPHVGRARPMVTRRRVVDLETHLFEHVTRIFGPARAGELHLEHRPVAEAIEVILHGDPEGGVREAAPARRAGSGSLSTAAAAASPAALSTSSCMRNPCSALATSPDAARRRETSDLAVLAPRQLEDPFQHPRPNGAVGGGELQHRLVRGAQ